MEQSTKLKLAKAKANVQKKTALEKEHISKQQQETLERFLADLSDLLNNGIQINGMSELHNLVSEVEQYAQRTSDLITEITRTASSIPNLDELELPESIELKTVTDEKLISTLKELGDNSELISKLQALDTAVVLLSEVISKAPQAGQTTEDYLPVRIVLGKDKALQFLESWPMPMFTGGTGGGLTNAELRASPVPVSATIDTTGLATSTKQDTLIGYVDGIETLITSTNTKLDTLNTTAATPAKATDAYAIAAISDDGTYKYFWFEDASLNYYIMRKTISTSVFQYTKGTGGYASVYQSSILGPSGSPSWASYGNTF